MDKALADHSTFNLERLDSAACAVQASSNQPRWREHFEAEGVRSRLIDTLAPAFRTLPGVAGAEPLASLQRAGFAI